MKKLYVFVNRNMRFVILGFIVAVFGGSAVLPAEFFEDVLVPAWLAVAAFSVLMAVGDRLWPDVLAEMFD